MVMMVLFLGACGSEETVEEKEKEPTEAHVKKSEKEVNDVEVSSESEKEEGDEEVNEKLSDAEKSKEVNSVSEEKEEKSKSEVIEKEEPKQEREENKEAPITTNKDSNSKESSVREEDRDSQTSQTPVVKEPVITTKTVTSTESIKYETKQQNDSSLEKGKTAVVKKGQNGVRIITYKETYKDGGLVSKEKVSSAVTKQPVDKVIKVGTMEPKPAVSTTVQTVQNALPSGYQAENLPEALVIKRNGVIIGSVTHSSLYLRSFIDADIQAAVKGASALGGNAADINSFIKQVLETGDQSDLGSVQGFKKRSEMYVGWSL